jgi:hypothetical protein
MSQTPHRYSQTSPSITNIKYHQHHQVSQTSTITNIKYQEGGQLDWFRKGLREASGSFDVTD